MDGPPVIETDVVVPKEQFPWNLQQANRDKMDTDLRTPDDPASPLHQLAQITSYLTTKKCQEASVPEDLRKLIKQEISVGTIQIDEEFLLRLNDLNVASQSYLSALEKTKRNAQMGAGDASENAPDSESVLLDDLLNYVLRKGMTALLNFLKVLYEQRKFDIVEKVLDHIRNRKLLLEDRQSTVDSSSLRLQSSVNLELIDVKIGRLHRAGDRVYKMESSPRGHVLIINNEDFRDERFKFRTGTHVDGAKLKKLFEDLGFLVDHQWDRTKKEMEDEISRFAALPGHETADCAVLIILSHGLEGGKIYGTDGEHMIEHDVREYFTAPNCPALADKPKIFLFAACRGTANDQGHPRPLVATDQDEPSTATDAAGFQLSRSDRKVDLRNKMPTQADFFVVYATYPGYVSYRDQQEGTWFVDEFVKVVSNEARVNHLADMIVEVNNRVSDRTTADLSKQVISVHTTLRRQVFFNPGFPDLGQ